jgi:hypothetical protein
MSLSSGACVVDMLSGSVAATTGAAGSLSASEAVGTGGAKRLGVKERMRMMSLSKKVFHTWVINHLGTRMLRSSRTGNTHTCAQWQTLKSE